MSQINLPLLVLQTNLPGKLPLCMAKAGRLGIPAKASRLGIGSLYRTLPGRPGRTNLFLSNLLCQFYCTHLEGPDFHAFRMN